MSQQAQSKGGWIASFVIVGTVLVLGLLAGLYYVKTRQIEESTQPVATEKQQPSDSEDAKNQAPKDTSNNQASREKTTDEKKKESSSDTATGQAGGENNRSSGVDEELPATGPGDVSAQAFGLVALVVSAAAYIQSRRGL